VKLITEAMVGLHYDERAFLAGLLNARLYQSESVRDTPMPGILLRSRRPAVSSIRKPRCRPSPNGAAAPCGRGIHGTRPRRVCEKSVPF
jgi:hypothetical protein